MPYPHHKDTEVWIQRQYNDPYRQAVMLSWRPARADPHRRSLCKRRRCIVSTVSVPEVYSICQGLTSYRSAVALSLDIRLCLSLDVKMVYCIGNRTISLLRSILKEIESNPFSCNHRAERSGCSYNIMRELLFRIPVKQARKNPPLLLRSGGCIFILTSRRRRCAQQVLLAWYCL